jgi:site-specific DNA-cytosine methylase
MGACYRQIGNAVPVKFANLLGLELVRIEKNELCKNLIEKETA